jgi:hypothetical protein
MIWEILQKHVTKKTIFAAICILFIISLSTVIEGFNSNKSLAQANSVQGVGVGIYWDQACINRTLSLSWGTIAAGSRNNLTVYVRNEGNSPVSLLLSTADWTPSIATSYMYLNWNYTNKVLKTDEVIPIELTLTVNTAIDGITDFSLKTTITTIETY